MIGRERRKKKPANVLGQFSWEAQKQRERKFFFFFQPNNNQNLNSLTNSIQSEHFVKPKTKIVYYQFSNVLKSS